VSIVRLTVYVTDKRLYLDALRDVGAAYRSLLGRHFPAMALVEVAGLVEPGALVEIEGTAAIAARENDGR
jgi:enamine deaminase RidA (YjgF/YER057c/UK114 family)